MKNMNGILIYEKGDQLPNRDIPGGLPVRSRFGFKAVDGPDGAYWEPATEADYRASEAKRLGIAPEDVALSTCHLASGSSCWGGCMQGTCTLCYNDEGHYHYCACVG